MRTKGSAAELEQRRRIAARLLEQGMKPIRVAEALGVSPAAVTRWRQAWRKGGEKALAAKPHPGGKPRMTPAQLRRLGKLLLKGPRPHGYPTELWTLGRVAEVIAVNFGVQYHPEWMEDGCMAAEWYLGKIQELLWGEPVEETLAAEVSE